MKTTHGGLRTPAGGRPRKDNVPLHCYVPPFVLATIDAQRGALKMSRGEYITAMVEVLALATEVAKQHD